MRQAPIEEAGSALRSGAEQRRPLAVAMVMGRLSRKSGGIFEAVSGLAPALGARPEVDVTVFGLDHPVPATDILIDRGVAAHAYVSHGPRSFGYAPGLDRALQAFGADLLHVHGLWMYPSVAAPRWAKARSAPYIVSPHGQLDPWALAHRGWKKRLATLAYERRHLRGAACLQALNEAELAAIRGAGLRNPVCVIPNGVDQPAMESVAPPRWRQGLPAHASILLFLGRLAPQKGLPHLLEGLARARDAAIAGHWQLVIAGWGETVYLRQLERQSEALGLRDIVHFIGPQFDEEKVGTLAAADAFVLPSLSEGLPIAVLEAWAAHLPVLMTPQCNLPEGFTETGAIAISADAESIEQGLRRLFAMPQVHLRRLGAHGRRLVAERYSWVRVADQMEAVYRWVLGLSDRPDTVRLP